MPKIVLKLKDPSRVMNLTRPEFWLKYKDYVLKTLELELPGYISNFVASGNFFTPRTGFAARSWRTKPNPARNSIVVWSVADYLRHLNYGVRPHQMTYLLNIPQKDYLAFGKYPYKARIVPMSMSTGTGTIFRVVTAKAMAAGKWKHPGIEPKLFLEKAIESYVRDFQSKHRDLVLEIAQRL